MLKSKPLISAISVLMAIGGLWMVCPLFTSDQRSFVNPALVKSSPHSPITIVGNAAMDAFFAGNGTNGLTWATAHVLDNIEINAQSASSGIEINDTTRYLIIRNCTITNSTAYSYDDSGIKLSRCTNIQVTNCTLRENFVGMRANYVRNGFFSNNVVSFNEIGTWYENMSINNTISGNHFLQNRDSGLVIDYSNNNTINLNEFIDNGDYGTKLQYAHNCTINNNTASNNSEGAIYLFWSNYASVTSNNITQPFNGPGIYLYGALNAVLDNNVMYGSGVIIDGIMLQYQASHTIPTSNKVNGKNVYYYTHERFLTNANYTNPGQIIFANCSNSSISGVSITNTTMGIALYWSESNNITGNTVAQNMHGILLAYFSRYNMLVGNDVSLNRRSGVNIHAANLNTVINNNASRTGELGLRLVAAARNTIVGNDASDNALFGIALTTDSGLNTIYFNRFAGNSWGEAYCQNETSAWDNGTAGNYWGDYATRYPAAVNDNVTWNTPYLINGSSNSYDNHALVWPFSFKIEPRANFIANTTLIIQGQSVGFTFTGNDGWPPATFEWAFGDGTPNATDENPVHQYSTAGNFTVTLTVRDAIGQNHTLSIPSYIDVIVDSVPTATFTANDTSIVEGQSVQLVYTGSGGNAPLTFLWSFGDASPNSTARNPTHQYTGFGNYTITLTVTDANGNSTTSSVPSFIDVQADILPTAGFMVNESMLVEGGWVQFIFTGVLGNGLHAYQWNFGDGSANSTLQHPLHEYTAVGNYTVTLSVFDDDNDIDVLALVNCVVVQPDLLPNVSFVGNDTDIVQGQAVLFTFTGTVGNAPATFQWNFGDGTANSTEAQPLHAFDTWGNFSITLTITDHNNDQATFSAVQFINVELDVLPTATFSLVETTIIAGSYIHFNFTGSAGNGPATFLWEFGSSLSTSTAQNPVFRFDAVGSFTITLHVWDRDGDEAIFTSIVTVQEKPPGNSDLPMELIITLAVVGIVGIVALSGYKRYRGSQARKRSRDLGETRVPMRKMPGSREVVQATAELALIPPVIIAFVNEPDTDKDLADDFLSIAANVPVKERNELLAKYLKEIKEFDDEF